VIDPVRPAKHLGNPYDNPALFEYLDSLEGVPDLLGPGETEAEREGWSDWQRAGNERFAALGAWAPGLALAAAVALAGGSIAEGSAGLLGLDKTPVSPILVAILLGLGIRQAVGLPRTYEPGLQLALKRILRVGVALLGIRLSLTSLGTIGLVALPVVVVCIASALFLVTRIGRWVGLPPRLAILIAAGTAICGNTAIVSLAPVIRAEDDEVSYAVGCITLFGLAALVAYPFVSHGLFGGDATLAGLFLGTAIHDTAQVAGAGLVYLVQYASPDALESATVTKLLRNMFMLIVIPGAAWLHQRGGSGQTVPGGLAAQLKQAVPLFVFGFLAMSVLRSLGDLGDRPFGVLEPKTWTALIDGVTGVSSFCLAIAMASVGLGTSLTRLRGLGLRPLMVGLVAALLVGGVSYSMIRLLTGLGVFEALA
jgi:uncharacterized integral membrane protein (TIGR00698 family)